MLRKYSVTIIIACIAIFVGLVGYYIANSQSEGNVITLTKNGFKPNEIEIKIGETVTFRNKTDKLFWPASDIHPYHLEYSDFDPKGPLPINGEWSFTFNRLGQWNFHDHISPNFTGSIIVKSSDGLSGGACYDAANRECWSNMISSVLEAEGVDAAYLELKRIHDSNIEFAGDCHTYGHDIGLKAYNLYGTDVELSEKTSWCNAGFYHGFMEGFIEDEADPKKIDEFCTYVGETLGAKFGLAEGHCRHGIGHGSLEKLLYDNELISEKPIDVVNKSMELCNATNNNREDMMLRCISGVYDTFRTWLYDAVTPPSQYLVENVLDFCVPYDKEYIKYACYIEMPKIMSFLDNPEYKANIFDFRKEIHPDDWDKYGPLSMRVFATRFGKRGVKEKTFEEMVGFCRAADTDLQASCILGIFDGIQFAGTPGEEYKVSSAFCNYESLTNEEKNLCFFNFQEEVFYTYQSDRWPEICEYIPDEFINPGRVCL